MSELTISESTILDHKRVLDNLICADVQDQQVLLASASQIV